MTWDCSSFKKPTPEELRQLLSDEQYQVTQAEGTEQPSETPTGTIMRWASTWMWSLENRCFARLINLIRVQGGRALRDRFPRKV